MLVYPENQNKQIFQQLPTILYSLCLPYFFGIFAPGNNKKGQVDE
jgi:hypothetical protein